MSKKKPATKAEKHLNEQLKYEIAGELGLLEKVRKGGWKSLTARESGQIGGILTNRKKALRRPPASTPEANAPAAPATPAHL